MIKSETDEKMDLEGYYPQNPFHIAFFSKEDQITIHFFHGRISAMPEIRADFFLAISKTGMRLLHLSCFLRFYCFGSQLIRV